MNEMEVVNNNNMNHFESIDYVSKKVLVRVDFNVPLDPQTLAVTDITRISAALPTLHFLIKKGAKVILLSHLGRPKNGPEDVFSLKHIVPTLNQIIGTKVIFVEDCMNAQTAIDAMQPGEVLLLENLRFYKEETKGDVAFAKNLAKYADIYINDAFGTAHRAHASTTQIAHFFEPSHKAFGYLMDAELIAAARFIHNPPRPLTAIIGGAKISDKIVLIENLLHQVDNLLIGGGMAFTFLKALGHEIGTSLCEDDSISVARKCWDLAKHKNVNLMLPLDSICSADFSNNLPTECFSNYDLPHDVMGLDIGPATVEAFSSIIQASKSIVWNGPMGVFEMSNFEHGTNAIAQAVADVTQRGAYSLVGGGDSIAALTKANLQSSVTHVSTGGGAFLELLEGKVLPGVAAISAPKTMF